MASETAIFAGGCFWCMVQPFDTYPGIKKVESGYTGGHVVDPTYEQVKAGGTGHTEAVRITFDPSVVSYADQRMKLEKAGGRKQFIEDNWKK